MGDHRVVVEVDHIEHFLIGPELGVISVLDEEEDVLIGVHVALLEEVGLPLPNELLKLFKCTLDVFQSHFFPVDFPDFVLWGGQNGLFVTVLFESFPHVLHGSGHGIQPSGRGLLVGLP